MTGKRRNRRKGKGQQDVPTTRDIGLPAGVDIKAMGEDVTHPSFAVAEDEPGLPVKQHDITPDTCAPRTGGTGARSKRAPKEQARPETVHSSLERLHLEEEHQPKMVESHALLPRRPGFGKLGRVIRLFANYFEVRVSDKAIHQYDVTITTERSSSKKDVQFAGKERFRVINSMRQRAIVAALIGQQTSLFRGCSPVYDGQKNLYTCQALTIPAQGKNYTVTESDSIYTVHLKEVAVVGLEMLHQFLHHGSIADAQSGIMALDTILRYAPSFGMVPVGRSFFTKPANPEKAAISGGLELWMGHFQSIRPTQRGVLLNIDKTGTTFYPEISVLQFMCKLFNRRSPNDFRILSERETRTLKEELCQVKFSVSHQPYRRVYRVAGVTTAPARGVTFPLVENGRSRTITVAAYLQERYNVKLEFPNLPCLEVRGTQGKPPSYFPVELCDIVPNQPSRGKLREDQTAEVIKFMATPPIARFEYIKQKARELQNINKNITGSYNIQMRSAEPIELNGRILTAPKVLFYANKESAPREGSWDIRAHRVLDGKTVSKWALISFSDRNCDDACLLKFKNYFVETAGKKGLTFAQPVTTQVQRHTCNIEDLFGNLKSRHPGLELVLCVLPTVRKASTGTGRGGVANLDPSIRHKIKFVAETKVGLRTQCIRDLVAQECKEQNVVNVCLKINSKMGGVNSMPGNKPDILKKPVMIVGVDAAHPVARTEEQLMYAAAVGSMDTNCSQYAVSLRVQEGRWEVLKDLKGMVKELLSHFQVKWKRFPFRIILYRDGVSEGQFTRILEEEVQQVGQACTDLDPNYRPKITFLVVQKRHHTRFMPRDERDGVGKCKNIPPGTTVDTDVCHPVNFDFFLCSHMGIQGTSRPTHYTVFQNDDNLNADQMQELTYYLCHTYSLCTRTLSIPPAVQYADMAAERARQHVKMALEANEAAAPTNGIVPVKDSISQCMYYL